MKNKYHDIIRKRLTEHRTECINCLRGGMYAWDDTESTVKLLNKILKDIPAEAWPDPANEDLYYKGYRVASGNWSITLMYTDDDSVRHADLRYANDDHTAWVKENKRKRGTYIDSDIGGS